MTKIAVVIGASSGIGQATAIRIAERGSGVVLTYNSNADGATQAVAQIEARGGTAVALPLDLGHSQTFAEFAERLAATIDERWRRTTFDYLVNNAGFGAPSMFGETSEELFDSFYRVLFKGPYFLTQELLPMLADSGAIVFTTSDSTRPNSTEPGYSAYASMKGAVTTLSRYLAKELSVRGIRVNSVAPGPTRTGMSSDAFDQYPEILQDLVDRTALGRIGESDDIARAIASLLSEDGAWITGEDIAVNGGFNI